MKRKTKADLTADLMAEKAKNQMLTKATESLVLKLSKTKNTQSVIDSGHELMNEISNVNQPIQPPLKQTTLGMLVAVERDSNAIISTLISDIRQRLYSLFPSSSEQNGRGAEKAKESAYNLFDQMREINNMSEGNINALREVYDFINQYA